MLDPPVSFNRAVVEHPVNLGWVFRDDFEVDPVDLKKDPMVNDFLVELEPSAVNRNIAWTVVVGEVRVSYNAILNAP